MMHQNPVILNGSSFYEKPRAPIDLYIILSIVNTSIFSRVLLNTFIKRFT